MIISSPRFAASRDAYPPRSSARRAYVAWVHDAVARYGKDGEFWRQNPARHWNRKPNVREYFTFLKQTSEAIHAEDAGAKVVLGSLADTFYKNKRNLLPYLSGLYSIPGAAKLFDVVAINVYAGRAGYVLEEIKRVRAVMNRAGDRRTPIWLTDTGWASGGDGKNVLILDRQGQASKLRQIYRLLIANRGRYRIGMAAWFQFRDRSPLEGEPNWWAINSGLFDRAGRPKPASRA